MIPTLGISSANKRSIYDTAVPTPDLGNPVRRWLRPLIIVRIQRPIVGYEVQEVQQRVSCLGMLQPFGNRELKMKAEGERSWDWQMLHTTPNVLLKNGEYVIVRGTKYRVMSNAMWTDYGYNTYELVQAYNKATNLPGPVEVVQENVTPVGDFSSSDFSPTDFST